MALNGTNWRDKDMLVDFCDVISPHSSRWWKPAHYTGGREAVRATVEAAIGCHWLDPPPKPIEYRPWPLSRAKHPPAPRLSLRINLPSDGEREAPRQSEERPVDCRESASRPTANTEDETSVDSKARVEVS